MKIKNPTINVNKGYSPMGNAGPVSITPNSGSTRANNGGSMFQLPNGKMNKGSNSGDRANELSKTRVP